jgi:penicillin-binding protein 2
VGNKVAYDLMVTPREVEAFDTLTFCEVLGVSQDFVKEKMAEYRKYRSRIGWRTVVMIKQLPQEST